MMIAWYNDVIKYICFVILIVTIDLITITKVHFMRITVSRFHPQIYDKPQIIDEQERRYKKCPN